MADLPDYYTQTAISEAEAASFDGGLAANRSLTPVSRDIYLGTDNQVLYVCFTDGAWTGFSAAMLTMGILTLYANMLGGGFRITNIADPTAAQDAATGAYVLARVALEATARGDADTAEAIARAAADALRLLLTGGTMAGNIIMGGNKLTGLGAGTVAGDSLRYEQLVQPTKEFFTFPVNGTGTSQIGYHFGYLVDAAGEKALMQFDVPADFTNLTSALMIIIPRATATMRFDFTSEYGAIGEAYNANSETSPDVDTACVNNTIIGIDASGALTGIAAGDKVGIEGRGDATTNIPDALVLGLRIKYS